MMRGLPIQLLLVLLLLIGATVPGTAEQDDGVAEFYSGHAALQQGDPEVAIAHFTKALEMGGLEEVQTAYVHHYRAIAFQRLDRQQESIEDYTQALALNVLPKRVQAAVYYNRAIALDRLANFDRAIKDYTSAVALKPDYAEAYMNRGNAYRKLGNNDQALRDYQASADYGNPIKHLPYYGQGLIHEANGDKLSALHAYQTALRLSPEFDEARLKVEGYEAAGVSAASNVTVAGRRVAQSGSSATKPSRMAVLRPQNHDSGAIVVAEGVTGATAKSAVAEASPNVAVAIGGPELKEARDLAIPSGASDVSKVEERTPAPAIVSAASASSATQPITTPVVAEKTKVSSSLKNIDKLAAVGAAVPIPSAMEPVSAKANSQPPAKVAPARVASSSSGFMVQVAAFTSQQMAESEALRIVGKNQALLSDLPQLIERADLGAKGVYYRLRFGGFASRSDAEARCSALKSNGQDCIIISAKSG